MKRVDMRMAPCPNLPKGTRCPLCGGAYICLQSNRPKAPGTVKPKPAAMTAKAKSK